MSMSEEDFKDIEISHFVVENQLGTVHRPVGERRRRAVVVLCPPLGRDWRSLYRTNFEWANLLARNGFPVIRFDPRGTGDSGEAPGQSDDWSEWINGVAAVSAFARETMAEETLCLAGFRLGGLLAGCAAEAAKADYLMLLAPHQDGLTWLRELQLESAIRDRGAGGAGEYNGITLEPASEQAIAAAKMPAQFPSVRGVFVAAANHAVWARRLAGTASATQPFPNWNTFFRDSHLITPPWEILQAATDWMCRQVESADARQEPVSTPGSVQLQGSDWIETPMVFGGALRGVLTRPLFTPGSTVVIFGNTAADPRSGASGNCKMIARGLARLGISTFRFDFGGVGESEVEQSEPVHVYETSRVGEFRAAATMLTRHGYADSVLAGICSGGYHAVQAALDDTAIKGAIAFNAWIVWHPGPLDTDAQSFAMRSAQMRLTGARHRVAGLYRKIAGRAATMRKIALSWFQERGQRAMQQRLRAAVQRGVQIELVYGRRDRALDGLWSEFGPMGLMLRRHKGFSARTLGGLDHSMLSRRSQAIAVQEIHAFLQKLKLGPRSVEQKEAPWILTQSAKQNRPTSPSSRT